MDQTRKNQLLLFGPTLVLGGASLWLHRYMTETCIDAKGLLIAGNLPGKLLWAAGIAFAVMLLLCLRRLGGNGTFADNFPRSIPGGLLMVLGGALLLASARELRFDIPQAELYPEYFQLFHWLGLAPALAAALGMIIGGLCRMQGRQPMPLFHGLVCLFYILLLITSYRPWSADPQLYSYAYPHLALVLLMLCGFHRTCCDAGILQRKKLLFTGLAAAFCSIVAWGGDYLPMVFLASAAWSLGCVCVPAILPPDPEDEADETPENADETPEHTGAEE